MTAHRRTPSVLGNWVHAIIRALDAEGIDGKQIALDAGVTARVIRDPEIRALQPAVTDFWHRAVEVTGDPCFGLIVPRFVTPATLGALAYGIIASPNLKAMFGRLVRYQGFISDSVALRFTITKDRGTFEIDTSLPGGPPFEGIDAFSALIVHGVRSLASDRGVNPSVIRMRRPAPPSVDRFHKTFRCEVQFGAHTNLIEYARTDLERRLPDGNIALARQSDEIVAQQLAAMDQETLSAQVLRALLEAMPDGPTERTIARRLCLSPSHLHRLLAAEGANYRMLLNQAREDLARGYLRRDRYSIKEIAFLLGFCNAAAFTRAFRRWTGDTPRRYANRYSE